MNEITLRHHFDAAGTSHAYCVAGPALLVQTNGPTAQLQGSNFPDDDASWQTLGTCTGYTPLTLTTSFAFVRVASAGAGDVAISGASAPAAGAGSGGNGGGDASAANQVTEIQRLTTLVSQTDAVEGSLASIDTKTPALSGGKVPVTDPTALPLPTGAATEATLATASGKLPASLGSKAGSASLSVTTATGVVTSIGGTVTTGGIAQQLAAANTARRGLTVQNTSTGELRVNPFGTASATAGYRVSAGDLLVLDSPHCGVGAVSVWGATTGQVFVGGEAV